MLVRSIWWHHPQQRNRTRRHRRGYDKLTRILLLMATAYVKKKADAKK